MQRLRQVWICGDSIASARLTPCYHTVQEYLALLATLPRASTSSAGQNGTSVSRDSGNNDEDEDNNEDAAAASLASIDSPFQVQEYLTYLIAKDVHNVKALVDLPRWRIKGSRSDTDHSPGKGKQKREEDSADIALEGSDKKAATTSAEDAQRSESTKEAVCEEDVSMSDLSSVKTEAPDRDAMMDDQDDENEEYEDEYAYIERDVWLYEHLR